MGLFAFYSVWGYGFDTVNNKAEVMKCMIARLDPFLYDLPSFMQVKDFVFVDEEWTQAEGMLTPTLKFKRRKIMARHQDEIDAMYGEEAGTSEESI